MTLDLDRTITVPKGKSSFSIFIDVIDDNIPEFNEQLVSSVGAIEGTSTIIDNDSLQPLIIATSTGATEGTDDYMRVDLKFNYQRQGELVITPEFANIQLPKWATPQLDFRDNLRLSNNVSFQKVKRKINSQKKKEFILTSQLLTIR